MRNLPTYEAWKLNEAKKEKKPHGATDEQLKMLWKYAKSTEPEPKYEELAKKLFGYWPKDAVPPDVSDALDKSKTADEFVSMLKRFWANESVSVSESRFTRLADTDEQEEAIANVEKWAKKAGIPLVGGTPMPEAPRPATAIIDLTHNGSEIYVSTEGEIEVGHQEVSDYSSFVKAAKEVLAKKGKVRESEEAPVAVEESESSDLSKAGFSVMTKRDEMTYQSSASGSMIYHGKGYDAIYGGTEDDDTPVLALVFTEVPAEAYVTSEGDLKKMISGWKQTAKKLDALGSSLEGPNHKSPDWLLDELAKLGFETVA